MDREEYLELWRGLIKISNFCYLHNCNNCDFMTARGCVFLSGKMPKFWRTPETIIKKAECPEIIVKELDKNDKTIIEEGDANVI